MSFVASRQGGGRGMGVVRETHLHQLHVVVIPVDDYRLSCVLVVYRTSIILVGDEVS